MRRASTLFLLFMPALLSACPVCDTETGRQVQAGIFNDSFGPMLLVAIAPFIVLAMLVALAHSGAPARLRRRITRVSDAGIIDGRPAEERAA